MNQKSDAMERSSTELTLFAIAFGGFVVGATGVLIPNVGAALIGLLVLSLALGAFGLLRSPDE